MRLGRYWTDNKLVVPNLTARPVNPKVVQERLGHSKMSTTMDIYSHVVPSMQKEAVKRFAMALEVGV